MNNLKCGDCHYYDVQFLIVKGERKNSTFGRCAKRSLYPAKERDGQVFPPDVERAAEDEIIPPEKILIVDGKSVRSECVHATRRGG